MPPIQLHVLYMWYTVIQTQLEHALTVHHAPMYAFFMLTPTHVMQNACKPPSCTHHKAHKVAT